MGLLRQFEMGILRDGDNLRHVVNIHTLLLVEAIDDILHGLVAPLLGLRSRPEEHTLVVDINCFQLPDLAWRFFVNPRRSGLQSRIVPVVIAQLRAIVAHVVDSGLGIPQDSTLDTLHLAVQRHLTGHLIELSRTLHVLADIEVGVADVVVPPVNQLVVVCRLVANLPIDLGYAVVHPPLLVPQQDVGIELIIVLQAIGATALGVALLVAIDAEGRDAYLHPRLDGVDSLVELFHEEVYVVATPVTYIGIPLVVGSKIGSIRDVNTCHRVRIEIVVDVQSVNIITLQDVHDDSTDVVAVLLQGWVQQRQSVIGEATLRMTTDHMARTVGMGSLRLGTIGIDPRMQLHAALVTLFNHPLQGVPIGLWRPTLLTRQVVAPGLQLTLIEGITLWAHLEDDGVATILLQLVQLVGQRLLHGLCRHAHELSVDTLYPCATELTFLLRLNSQGQQHHQE